MRNYAKEWKDYVRFKESKYNDFIEDHSNITGYYLEKIDGMLAMLIYERGKQCIFQTTTGSYISDLPVIGEYYKILNENKKINQIVIAGELISMLNGKMLGWGQSQSIIKTAYYIENNKDLVNHYMYDILELNGKRVSFNSAVSFINNNFNFKEYKYIHFPEIRKGNIVDFIKLYKDVVLIPKTGVEGIVVRSTKNFKVKPFQSIDFGVIAFGKVGMPAWNKKQISYLVPSLLDKDKVFRTSSKVGTGFKQEERESLFKYCMEHKVYEDNGIFFVKPLLVVEVYCLRYHVNNMPSFKYENNKYIYQGKKKCITLINPRFTRIRTDKKVEQEDIRLGQIPEFSEEI